MNRTITGLMAALKEKRNALECMRAILEEENKHIIGLDYEKLRITTSGKQQVIERIAKLNNECVAAIKCAHEELGTPAGSGLSSLTNRLRGPERDMARSLQSAILAAARNNERLIVLNKDLLESSLDLIERSLRFFKKFMTSGNTYGEGGQMLQTPSGPRLVRKEM
jgi:hypothetical protein